MTGGAGDRQIVPYKGIVPRIAGDAFIADGARIVGDVEIGPKSSVWFNCVVRADVEKVRIGRGTNLQDGTVVHETKDLYPTLIGDYVLIGHKCLLHGCTLEDHTLIGMGAIVMDDVVVEEGAMIAAGSLVTPGKRIRRGQLWAGSPAKHMRDLSKKEIAHNSFLVDEYIERASEYLES